MGRMATYAHGTETRCWQAMSGARPRKIPRKQARTFGNDLGNMPSRLDVCLVQEMAKPQWPPGHLGGEGMLPAETLRDLPSLNA
jgi:hypothetical protein